jgi:hypothetical protein
MPSKDFTNDDVANLLLTDENNLKDDLWSDEEGSEDKEITESEHEDDGDYEREEGGEGSSNGHDGGVTISGEDEKIIRG